MEGLESTESTESASEPGMAQAASAAVADAFESTRRFIQEEGLKNVAEDIKTLIVRNPIPAVLLGVGLGFLIGRAMGPRS